MRSLLVCLCLALAGCGVTPPAVPQTLTVTKTVYVPWTWPAYLKTCAPDAAPLPVPHVVATDAHAGSAVAKYIAGLRAHDAAAVAAADDCRNTLAAAVQANSAPAN